MRAVLVYNISMVEYMFAGPFKSQVKLLPVTVLAKNSLIWITRFVLEPSGFQVGHMHQHAIDTP